MFNKVINELLNCGVIAPTFVSIISSYVFK